MEEIVQEQLLEIKHLEKSYEDDSPVLKDISLSVKKGEVVVLLGPSGCGKSTLLRTIMGLEHIQGGEILLEGKNIVGKSEEARKERQNLGMVFQSYDLFPHMNIMENLLLAPMKVQGRKREEAVQDAYPSMLSGGQKQRVAIIRSLMMHPKLMLFDEVTAALDPEMVREVLDVVMELSEQGLTMLIVTHEMGFAKAVADRVLFLEGGKILEENTPENFFQKPDTERAQQFLQNFSYVSHRHVGR